VDSFSTSTMNFECRFEVRGSMQTLGCRVRLW
jgi:hypothetical protein